MRKGRIRWQKQNGFWSSWYDLNEPISEELKQIEVIAIELQEEMTKTEYEALHGKIA